MWNFDDLEPITTEPIQAETGKGFFPGLPTKTSFFGAELISSFNYTEGRNLSTPNFANSTYTYNADRPNDFADIFDRRGRWNNDEEDHNLDRVSLIINFNLIYNFTLPFFFEAGTNFEYREDFLVSDLGERPYLSSPGEVSYFNEYSVIDLTEVSVSGRFGIKLPIYGGFIKMDNGEISSQSSGSFYLLNLHYVPEYVFISRANQYNIMTSQKNRLRYASGYDTLRVSHRRILPGTNSFRNNIQIGLSSMSYFLIMGIEFGISYRFPLTAIVEDINWKNHLFQISTTIRF